MDLENSFLNALSAMEVVHFTAGGVTLKNKARISVLEFVLPPTMAAPVPVVQRGEHLGRRYHQLLSQEQLHGIRWI
jgi:hypothetical protein